MSLCAIQKGAATIVSCVDVAIETIATFPRAARRDQKNGTFGAIVCGAPLLIIYEIVISTDGAEQVDIVAVFNTARDRDQKPGRREA